MGKRARWILCIVALLAVVGMGLAKLRRGPEPIARFPLPDGTELRLEYVTYGTHHVMPGAGALVSWLTTKARLLPYSRISYLEAEYTRDTAAPCPVVWFTCRDPRKGMFVDTGVRDIFSAKGYPYRSGFSSGSTTIGPQPNYSYAVPSYDRRKATFPMRMKAFGKIIDIDVPNPVAGAKFPEWKPEPLPQTQHAGGYEVVLRSFELVGSRDDIQLISPRIKVVKDGLERADIKFQVSLSDATGNSETGGRLMVAALPLTEPAWKLRVELHGTGSSLEKPETVEFIVAPPKLPEPKSEPGAR